MRFYPRQVKTRADALAGPSHIANPDGGTNLTSQDRLLRRDPGLDLGTVRKEYGGTV